MARPPFLTVMQEMIEAADFVVIPVQASTPDLLSTQDAVVLAREAGASHLVVFNAVDPKKRFAENARESREQTLLASLIACRQYLLLPVPPRY